MSPVEPLVAVIDDDQSVREALPDLIRAFGFSAVAFSSAEDFLASGCLRQTHCLVLDVGMPGMTGPELQKVLSEQHPIPIIFITAQADDARRAQLMKAGAVDCLWKPFGEDALLDALERALGRR